MWDKIKLHLRIESPYFKGLENGKYPYIKIGEQIIKMKKEK